MHCSIYDHSGINYLRWEEREPTCGEDFCDRCGDCLACDGDGPCYGSGSADDNPGGHWWVVYELKEKDEQGD